MPNWPRWLAPRTSCCVRRTSPSSRAWPRASSVTPGGLEAEAFFPRFGAQSAWLYFTATPLRDAQGQIIGAIETLQDVTERRRAQEELLRHRDELEQKVQQRSAELAATVGELERFVT